MPTRPPVVHLTCICSHVSSKFLMFFCSSTVALSYLQTWDRHKQTSYNNLHMAEQQELNTENHTQPFSLSYIFDLVWYVFNNFQPNFFLLNTQFSSNTQHFNHVDIKIMKRNETNYGSLILKVEAQLPCFYIMLNHLEAEKLDIIIAGNKEIHLHFKIASSFIGVLFSEW